MTRTRKTSLARSNLLGGVIVGFLVGSVYPGLLSAQGFPEQLGWWALGDTTEVALGQSVVAFNRGPVLMVEEIGDVAEPRSGEINLGEVVQDIALAYNIAWVLGEQGGLVAVDVEDPGRLVVIGSIQLSERVRSLAANEEIVAVSGFDGLTIIDVFDPSLPVVSGTADWERSSGGNTTLDGETVYVADGGAATILDVGDVRNPTVLGQWSGSASDVAVVDTLMYAFGGDWLNVVDIANSTNPATIATLRIQHSDGLGKGSIAASGGIVVASSNRSSGSASVIEVSMPTEPELTGTILVNGEPSEVVVRDTRCVVASASYWSGGVLSFLDLSFPPRPVMEWSTELPGRATAVAVAGDIIVSGTDMGLVTLDVSGPDSVRVIGSLDLDDSPSAIALRGNLAFVVGPAWGVKAIDISEPSQPVEVGSLLTWGSAYDLAVDGHLLYIADDHRGLAVVDASDPTDMVTVARWDTAHLARVVAHERALVALGQTGLGSGVLLFDISDPERPVRIGELHGVSARDLTIQDGLLYAAGGSGGVSVFDVNDPFTPTAVVRIPCVGYSCRVQSLTLVGDQLWFLEDGNRDGTLKVYNMSKPSMPIFAGEEPLTGFSYSIAAGLDRIATAGNEGIRIFATDTRLPVPRRPDGRSGD